MSTHLSVERQLSPITMSAVFANDHPLRAYLAERGEQRFVVVFVVGRIRPGSDGNELDLENETEAMAAQVIADALRARNGKVTNAALEIGSGRFWLPMRSVLELAQMNWIVGFLCSDQDGVKAAMRCLRADPTIKFTTFEARALADNELSGVAWGGH